MKSYIQSFVENLTSNEACVEIMVNNQSLLLSKYNDEWFVTSNICPHQGAKLNNQKCINGLISCPLHGYKFKLKNGYNISGEGYKLTTYDIFKDENGMYINLVK